MNDKIVSVLAILIVTTGCGLAIVDKLEPTAFLPIIMYVVKKYFDKKEIK